MVYQKNSVSGEFSIISLPIKSSYKDPIKLSHPTEYILMTYLFQLSCVTSQLIFVLTLLFRMKNFRINILLGGKKLNLINWLCNEWKCELLIFRWISKKNLKNRRKLSSEFARKSLTASSKPIHHPNETFSILKFLRKFPSERTSNKIIFSVMLIIWLLFKWKTNWIDKKLCEMEKNFQFHFRN